MTTTLARLRVARAALLDAAQQLLDRPADPNVHARLAAVAFRLDEAAATISDAERTIELLSTPRSPWFACGAVTVQA
jgi:hypothetical protein